MNVARWLCLCTGLTLTSFAQTLPPAARTPVLVELFTSEGCSSCPPADALLDRLQREQPIAGADIIAFGEHVDYWDKLGWHDRFSSHAFTERQSLYSTQFHRDDIYTPQMVVNGTAEFVGNDATLARKAIASAARGPQVSLTLASPIVNGHRVSSSVTVAGSLELTRSAAIFAALVQPKAVTNVRSGENGGRTLTHVAVVRSLREIGQLAVAAKTLSFALDAPLDIPVAGLRLMLFVQTTRPGQPLGAILGITSAEIH